MILSPLATRARDARVNYDELRWLLTRIRHAGIMPARQA
jgi:hypothetical protein